MEIATPSGRVAANVRGELARQRRTQIDLGQALGRSQPYVSRRLNGRVAFDVDELSRVADFLGVTLAVLLGSDVAA